MPAIYIQSIIGSNDYEGVERLGYNRAINRKKYQAGEIDHKLDDINSLRHKVYSGLSALISLRRQEKAFHPDSQARFETSGEHVLKIVRIADNGERIIALFNFSNDIQHVPSNSQAGKDLITGNNINDTTLVMTPTY